MLAAGSEPNSEPAYAFPQLAWSIPVGAKSRNWMVWRRQRRTAILAGKPVQRLRPGSLDRPDFPGTVPGRRRQQHPGTPGSVLAYTAPQCDASQAIATSGISILIRSRAIGIEDKVPLALNGT